MSTFKETLQCIVQRTANSILLLFNVFFKAGLLVDDHRVVARHKRIWNYKTKDEYEPEQWLLNFEIKIE